ncbi:MAG TPA: M23 family metallopeptidase, partial [Chloroflexaceae bacterium]|nr:M23 family metallopeptidase [Chloroflexaceae bacterium]
MRPVCVALALLLLVVALLPPAPAAAQGPGGLGVQRVLDAQPGPLKGFTEEGRSAATIIEGAALYYGLSPQLHLALLEATAALLSDPAPPPEALSRPFGAGPAGFAAQIDWASRELRAGLGPYSRPPVVRFSDGTTLTLTLDQAPEGVAVQRFLARGRAQAEWRAAVERFGDAFQRYFNNQLVRPGEAPAAPPAAPRAPVPAPQAGAFTLRQPWPMGTRVVHLAYFDHMYPTVDSGDDGNSYVVNYLGQGNVQYDGHDGHDYYFPDQPVGTPILAAAGGLAYARTHRGYGVVILHPDGYETVYWHLDGFAPIFAGLIDSNQPVPVEAGAFIGTSGTTGFVRGTPHLHFEVRRYGRQIDPYGWYGPGPDPCAAYAGCLAGVWLWDQSLVGTYDFTPPDAAGAPDGASAAPSGPPAASGGAAGPAARQG